MFSRPLEPLFVRALAASSGLVPKHMDVIAADTDYRHYARYLASGAVRRLPWLLSPFRGKAG